MLQLLLKLPVCFQVEDAGRYTCLAFSSAGDDDKEYLVRVHGRFEEYFFPKLSCKLWRCVQHVTGYLLLKKKYVFWENDIMLYDN